MKKLAILSQKGGTGKSTIACSLAVCADQRDQIALIIDVDEQGTSYQWAQRRVSETPTVITAQPPSLAQLLTDAQANGADLVIIDTPARSANSAVQVVKNSDLVLIPCRASIHDIDAIENSVNIAKLANVPAVVILNAVPPNAPKLVEELQQALRDNYGVNVLPVHLAHRAAYVHSALTGQSASEFEPDGKASQEINALFNAIFSHLEQLRL